MSIDTQTIASYMWQEADPRFAPLPGRNRQAQSNMMQLSDHEMVEITVVKSGYENEFIVHKELLTRYQQKLFAKIFGPGENLESLRLVEDPKVFVGLLQFAYRGRFWLPETVGDIDTLWDIYLLAEKKEIPNLQDVMMNRITCFYFQTKTFPTMEVIRHVYKHTKREFGTQKQSVARRFLARCYVCISFNFFYGGTCADTYKRIEDARINIEGLHLDTLQAIHQPAGTQWKMDLDPRDSRRVSQCDYHQHARNEKCPLHRETPFNNEADR
ncbi:c61c74f5-1873-492e-b0b6-e92bbcac672e [Sclerotinia trifoliorum]|uniref:C61c74f5-1873-492e-b0b6-e92bbcac672e n=1 Tax=Sclerotinia trifoliorum TaxID=28548 RepID=A0A8H2ZQZ8_9HELO|nr:c61c74f5-1873-492e-b0b6-e92bbcac672e [Sclerotinia trifoliorum]